jgi:hypothetical protein
MTDADEQAQRPRIAGHMVVPLRHVRPPLKTNRRSDDSYTIGTAQSSRRARQTRRRSTPRCDARNLKHKRAGGR